MIFNKPFHKQILKISVLQSSKTSKGVCKRAFNMASCLLKIQTNNNKKNNPIMKDLIHKLDPLRSLNKNF